MEQGFGVSGSRFRVWSLRVGFEVTGIGLRVEG